MARPDGRGEEASSFGVNVGLVDELYDAYAADPLSVSESWRDFFEGYEPRAGTAALAPDSYGSQRNGQAKAGLSSAAVIVAESDPPQAGELDPVYGWPHATVALRGSAARVAENMAASLSVPTATSTRVIPARLLEVNRQIVNRHLARVGSFKVSFTHLIGYAVIRALEAVPAMKAIYSDAGGSPTRVVPSHVRLGLAVDLHKPDGSHRLLVPAIADADTLDFAAFHRAYEDVVGRVRSGNASPSDFAGVVMTLTNPGTLGTVSSVPRLPAGQSVIVGVGAVDYPAEFGGADLRVLADLGVSKTVTITSTYDHRVIQGAESGLFLARIHALLLGAEGFYDDVFTALSVPYQAVEWRADSNGRDRPEAERAKQVHVQNLINTYRVRGHLIADLDPLGLKRPAMHPELDPATHGLTIWDLDREFFVDGVGDRETMTLGDVLGVLRDAYCRRIGVEYMHISEPAQKKWIQRRVEATAAEPTTADQLHILNQLNAAEAFERFLHTKYVGHKRFGLEGAESLVPLLSEILDRAADSGCTEAVMGMAHRGRLNVLANIVGKPLAQIFREFEGDLDPSTTQGSGDVRYHLGASGTFVGRDGRTLPVKLASNPSHLEAVGPVVEGIVRARQDLIEKPRSQTVLPVLIHGDAAFAGQGVVAETLNLSALRGYRVGGTIHVVVNNQLGFTTGPVAARSSVYPTDVAKAVQAPIFHVNGDDPEACSRVGAIAFDFRQTFHRDVVIDMVCYRRHGHNEGDDPSYTQPLMYRRIDGRRSVRKIYTETLVRRGDITGHEAQEALDDFLARMQDAFEQTRSAPSPSPVAPASGPTANQPNLGSNPSTEVDAAILDRVMGVLGHPPPTFTLHPKLRQQFEARSTLYEDGMVDWALAESLALGSLLIEGFDVRLTGQDTRRGTFSQRHAALADFRTGEEWVPLEALGGSQGRARIYDSALSEYAALGFEYGYSTAHPHSFVAWEAQFGDFANGAQVVIDQFIAAASDKWGEQSSLLLLLPHGFEGQGPEHSSARVERFLSLCADGNLRVAYPTTAAQYFHLLRRQTLDPCRIPLIVFTPKSLLRAKSTRSPVAELTGERFFEVLDDPNPPPPSATKRLVLASGKVAREAMAARDERMAPVAVIRVEQLEPWPHEALAEVMARYPECDKLWLQEEPKNMGAWTHVRSRLEAASPLGPSGRPGPCPLRLISRRASPSPATGSNANHIREQADLLTTVFDGL